MTNNNKFKTDKKILWIAGSIIGVTFFAFWFVGQNKESYFEAKQRKLIESILENDYDKYIQNLVVREIGEYKSEELIMLKEPYKLILEKWLDNDEVLWNDEKKERITVLSVIINSGSSQIGRIGVADTPEGMELLRLAVEQYERTLSRRPDTKMVLIEDADGNVLVGMQGSIHRPDH